MPDAKKHTAAGSSRRTLLPLKKPVVILLFFVFAAMLYCFGVGLALPYWGRPFLERELSAELGVPCTIGAVTANPFTLKLTARDVAVPYPEDIRDKTGEYCLRLEQLEIVPSPRSFPERALIISELRLIRPHISLTRFKDGSLSPQTLLKAGAANSDDDDLFPVAVHNLTVREGTLDFRDAVHGIGHTVTNVNLSVPFASTLLADKDAAVTPTLSATVNGREINVSGESRPFAATRQTEFTLLAKELGLAEFRHYIAPYTKLSLQSGSLQSALLLRFAVDPEHAFDIALAGTVAIRDLALADGKTPVFAAKEISLDMENVVLGPRRVIIKEALLDAPSITVHRRKDGSLNWAGYFSLPEDAPKSAVRITSGHGAEIPGREGVLAEVPPQGGLPLQLVLGRADVRGGAVTWRDDVPKEPVRYTLDNINAAFTDVSTEDEGRATFEAGFGSGNTNFSAQGKATTNPMQAEVAVSARGIPLAPFSPYLAESAGLRLDAGTLDAKGDIVFRLAPDKTVRLANAEVSLDGVRTFTQGEKTAPFAAIDRLRVGGIAVDLAAQTARVGKFSGSGLGVAVTRGSDGAILLPAASAPAAPPSSNEKPGANEPLGGTPWKIAVDAVDIAASRFTFTDNALQNPATLSLADIAVKGADFTTFDTKRWSLAISGKPGTRGSLGLTAKGTLSPLDLAFSGTMDKADMRPLSPYLREVTRLTLEEATLGGDFSGSVKRVPGSERGGAFAIKGNLGVYGVTLLRGKRELGGWGRMRIAGVDYAVPASGSRKLSVESVTVNTPRLSVSIDPSGVSSLSKAFQIGGTAEEGEETTPEPSATEPVDLTKVFAGLDIGSVSVSQGQANYTDRRLSPSYSLKVDGITVALKNLSLDPARQSTLTGNLTVNGSPITVAGSGSSLLTTPAASGTLAVRSLDLARFTRYAEKYLGYPVQSGVLHLDVTASLAGKELDLRSSALIQKLELGKKVSSPYAADMPLPTAVTLLRSLDGSIRLDVPVSGTIGDPEFKLGGVVGAVIGNVILKTVTSPFTLLGSIVSGAAGLFSSDGPRSLEIVFPIGEDSLDATAQAALEELGKELYKYPAATLEVTGVADRSEKNVLVDAWVNKALQRMKYAALPPAEKAKTTPDAVRVSPTRNAKEYAELLTALYTRLPFVKKSADPEIRSPQSTRSIMRILRKHIEIGDNELRILADTRARAVYRAVSQGKIDLAARIKLQESTLADAETSGERIASYARITVRR